MKKEELTALGLNEEQIKGVQKLNGTDIEAAKKSKTDELQPKIDDLTKQLNTATEGLKKFEGVDVDQLQGEIQKLNKTIADNKAAYDASIRDRDFTDKLNASITKAGGRNTKAIAALLDLDALKASKNQDTDIASALETVKKDNDYLFGADQPIKNGVSGTSGSAGVSLSDEAKLAAARAAFGLPPVNKQK